LHQQVDFILNLPDFGGVKLLATQLVHGDKLWLMINILVIIPESKNGAIIHPDSPLIIEVVRGPIVIVDDHREHFGVQQVVNNDTLLNDYCERVDKKITGNITILKANDVVNYQANALHLVIFQRDIDRIGVIKILAISFADFVLVDNRKQLIEILVVLRV
jgi:hypothetical protein